jgi:hypothetical protein
MAYGLMRGDIVFIDANGLSLTLADILDFKLQKNKPEQERGACRRTTYAYAR